MPGLATPDATFLRWGFAPSVRKCGGKGGKPGPCPLGSRVASANEINASPMLHRTNAIEQIKQGGFQIPSNGNAMYGRGLYFSDKDVGISYGKDLAEVELLPHKQLLLDEDTDVPRVVNEITGQHYLSDQARIGMIAAGYGSARFKVDNDTYTVVYDPALIRHKTKSLSTQIARAATSTDTGPLPDRPYQELDEHPTANVPINKKL